MLNLIPKAFGYYIPYRTIDRKENEPNEPNESKNSNYNNSLILKTLILKKYKISTKSKSVSKNEKTDN